MVGIKIDVEESVFLIVGDGTETDGRGGRVDVGGHGVLKGAGVGFGAGAKTESVGAGAGIESASGVGTS